MDILNHMTVLLVFIYRILTKLCLQYRYHTGTLPNPFELLHTIKQYNSFQLQHHFKLLNTKSGVDDVKWEHFRVIFLIPENEANYQLKKVCTNSENFFDIKLREPSPS